MLVCSKSLGRFMIRALDWLRAAIGALLETSMRRLRLVGCAVEAAKQGGAFGLPLETLLALGESCTPLQQSWELALTSQLTFKALEEPARAHCDNIQPRWTAQIRTGPLARRIYSSAAARLRLTYTNSRRAPPGPQNLLHCNLSGTAAPRRQNELPPARTPNINGTNRRAR